MKPGDKPAYPTVGMMQKGDQSFLGIYAEGMTIRQWYKGMAIQGLLASPPQTEAWKTWVVTDVAYIADALIAEDEEHKNETGR